MLHYRNTYKNCKMMRLYLFLDLLTLIAATIFLLFAMIPEFRIFSIILSFVFSICFIILFFLTIMKNNNYKLKYYFRLKEFNKEFKEFEKLCKGNKKRVKEIKKQQKDQFLQFGEVFCSKQSFDLEQNAWNNWIEDAVTFSYPNAGYMEKLSFLTYQLYNACASGGGFEEFFRSLSYEPFTKEELLEIINKSSFYSDDFKELIVNIIQEYSEEIQDVLFERYKDKDNKVFFTYESELYDYANWLVNNRVLLSSCPGVYIHGNINFNMYRLFLSKSYKRIIFIYSKDDKVFKVGYKIWDFDSSWFSSVELKDSIYDSVESAVNDIQYILKDFDEIQI